MLKQVVATVLEATALALFVSGVLMWCYGADMGVREARAAHHTYQVGAE